MSDAKTLSIFELEDGKEYINKGDIDHGQYYKKSNGIIYSYNKLADQMNKRDIVPVYGYTEVQPEPKMVKWYEYTYSRLHGNILGYGAEHYEIYVIISRNDWATLNFASSNTLLSTLTLEAPESASIQEVYEMFKKMEKEVPDFHYHCDECSAVQDLDCEKWQQYNQEACNEFKKMEAGK